MKSFKVEKLLRDHVPSLLRTKGIEVHEREMLVDEFIQKLKNKLVEEAEEVKETQSREELVEELADVVEVIQTLSSTKGITLEEIERKRMEKRKLKGGFEQKIFNSHIEIDEHNPVINYYLNKSTQYPEINFEAFKPGCLFCQMSKGEKEISFFAKFEHCFVIKDQFPVSPGHLLIIPYHHADHWFKAAEEVRLDMMKALHVVKEKLDVDYAPQGYNMGANCGKVAGQTIMHLHVHLIPRYSGDMEDPKGGVRGVIPSKQKY